MSLAATTVAATLASCAPNCDDRVIHEQLSPTRSHKATVYSSLCGFNIASNTQVSILAASDSARGRSNIFAANISGGEAMRGPHGGPLVSARWLRDGTLEIAYDTASSVIWRKQRYGEFTIKYRALEQPPAR